MIPNHFRIFSAVTAIFLVASACSLPLAAISTPTPLPEPSAIPATISVPTETALAVPSNTEKPTVSIVPTEKATGTATLAVGFIPTETATATPEPVTAEVMRETNCRTGPGPHYDLIATYKTGAKLEVIARDLDGGFIFTQNPEKPEEQCYILANNVQISGDTKILPRITPLASPTSAPSFTATFKKFDLCKGKVYAQFVIQNTGSMPFRSAYIKVINLKTNDSTEKAVDAFDLTTGCIIAKNIAPLEAGATGYLSSEAFLKDPRGNKMKAIIQVCTEKSSKGVCVNNIVDIKP
ncbi:MAG: hypothetical protein WCK35_05930 [Chloroflexota bacterium]